ncbi:MAG: magnesium/cobalt transporter CorA [Desulfuromonadales bacterium]|nr:magnesium/cobalt transporter CorA [Desulfuromonadales bacterium]
MKRIYKRRSKKVGTPPGTLIHIGEEQLAPTKVDMVVYNKDQVTFSQPDLSTDAACIVPPKDSSVLWVNMDGVSELPPLKKLGECFGIHPLVLEDIVDTAQRPKAEEYSNYLFVLLKMLKPGDDGVKGEQVSIILGDNWVLTFQEGLSKDIFNPIKERLENSQLRLRSQGADYLVYGLMDIIVDNYFLVLDSVADNIEILEEELMDSPTPKTLAAIYNQKRELLFLHKSIWPLREVISSLYRQEAPQIQGSTIVYLRDLYDHTIQVIETVETLRDMLSGMLDIYLSSVSNKMNGIMKVLTIIATIFMPITFIVGLYGMNFKNMPELEWPWGYPAVLILMLVIVIAMVIFFRRKDWI